MTFAYQWYRCDTKGQGCSSLPAATTPKYVLQLVDVGTSVKVVVKATNSVGSASAASEPTAPIGDLAQPPSPPQPYTVPPNAIPVSNSSELIQALAKNKSADIVLRDGTYDNSTYFDDTYGNRLYAEQLGGAVLTAGIMLGNNWGPGGGLLRGLTFNVADPSKTLRNAIIHTWGTGVNSQILDVRLEGNNVIGAGIKARQVDGLVIQRVVARDFTDYGVLVDENVDNPLVSVAPVVSDVDVANVSRPVPQSSNGTAEACIEIGNLAHVSRIHATGCAWEGLWAGTASTGSDFQDIRVLHSDIGVYVEHFDYWSTFTRLEMSDGVTRGLTCEWADPYWRSLPACNGDVVQQSYFQTDKVGVYLDAGTTNTTVRSSTFVNQCWAGIGNYEGTGNLQDTSGNDYSAIRPGAVPITAQHYYAATC